MKVRVIVDDLIAGGLLASAGLGFYVWNFWVGVIAFGVLVMLSSIRISRG